MGEPNVRSLLAHRLHLPDRFLYQSNEEIKTIDFGRKNLKKIDFSEEKILKDKKSGHTIACMIPDFFVMTHLIRYLKISYLLTLKYSSFASSILPSPKGANVNNRGWNDRREWNLRIVTDSLLSSPKGANRGKTGCGSPPLGTLSPYY